MGTYDISGEDRTGSFVLLASDGLWDVMANDEVAEFVRRKLQEIVPIDEGQQMTIAAKQLHAQWKRVAELVVSEALKRGSTDNISVVIIMMK